MLGAVYRKKEPKQVQTISGTIMQGYSGAPAFSFTDDHKLFKFNGVCISGEPGNKPLPKLIILRPEIVTSMLKKKLSQKVVPTLDTTSTLKKWIQINGLE